MTRYYYFLIWITSVLSVFSFIALQLIFPKEPDCKVQKFEEEVEIEYSDDFKFGVYYKSECTETFYAGEMQGRTLELDRLIGLCDFDKGDYLIEHDTVYRKNDSIWEVLITHKKSGDQIWIGSNINFINKDDLEVMMKYRVDNLMKRYCIEKTLKTK